MVPNRRILKALALVGSALAVGCEAQVSTPGRAADKPFQVGAQQPSGTGGSSTVPGTGTPNITPPTASACSAAKYPGPSPIRRLTRREYNGTVQELLKDTSAPAQGFVAEETALGFNNNALALTISTLLVEQYLAAAEKLSVAATADLTQLLPCDPAADADGCAGKFIADFGERAFRRPITTDEQLRFQNAYLWGKQHQDFRTGIEMVIEAMLQSASFLYRVEFGEGTSAAGNLPLTNYELASRLSYLFLGSMPDVALRTAAKTGQLSTPQGVDAQALRLSKDPRARATVADFHAQWLGLQGVSSLERDPAVYTGYTAALPGLFVSETQSFVDNVFWEGEGTVQALLTAPYTFLNSDLAKFYGVIDPGGAVFAKSATDGVKRAGLLSQGSLLAVHAKPLQTSPVHRGKFVREQFLCQQLPPPPANLVITPPELDPKLSTRERFAQHSKDIACSGCHSLMDPIGLGFEHFDPVGRYRDTENGKPVSGAGELLATDINGTFDGAVELGAKLATSAAVSDCVTTEWFRYAFGRSETPEDACSVAQLKSAMKADNNRMQSLLLAFTKTDAFLYRKVVTP